MNPESPDDQTARHPFADEAPPVTPPVPAPPAAANGLASVAGSLQPNAGGVHDLTVPPAEFIE